MLSVALVVYAPATGSGFRLVDDGTHLQRAGSMSLSQYLLDSFDPSVQSVNYRPIMRLWTLVQYTLFRSDAAYYHLAQILLHASNSLLVFGIVAYYSRRWNIGSIGGILFAGFPVANEAVFWISEHSPAATLFCLVAILGWMRHLRTEGRWSYGIALSGLVLALLSKESSIALPVVLLLIDCLLVRKDLDRTSLLRRYLPIGLLSGAYLGIEYVIQSHGLYVDAGGYSIGPHIFFNSAAYVVALFFPWQPLPSGFATWGIVLLAVCLTCIAILKRHAAMLFLLLATVVSLGPVVMAPLGIGARYLYAAAAPFTILLALGFQSAWRHWKSSWLRLASPVALAFLVLANGYTVADAAAQFTETLRQARVPFRDIMRQHPTFPADTRLFLIEPPNDPPMTDVAGLFFLNYTSSLSVGGTWRDGRPFTYGRLHGERAGLRDHSAAYVYYFDNTDRPVEVPVAREAPTEANPVCPCDFQSGIRLEGYELTSANLKLGQPLALLLYWRATGHVGRDYTVFAHLVDASGNIVVGEDSRPRNGKEATSTWRPNQFTADGHILKIPEDMNPGVGYRLEVGLYDLNTMERLSIVDGDERPVADTIVIQPLEITR